jgi:hypothetical protein
MTPLFKKLNFKEQASLLCLNAPASFATELAAMSAVTGVHQTVDELAQIDFALAFVTQQSEIDRFMAQMAPKLVGDAVLWFCYPKGTSKKYRCDFNRDTGWATLGQYDLEGVRQVAIDTDWSALRFRKVAYIKTLNRRQSMALSDEGKQRTAGPTEK